MTSYVVDHKLFEHIVYSSINGMIAFDQKGIILMAGPATCELFGYTSEELVSQSVKIIFIDLLEDFEAFTGKIVDVEGKRKDGSIFSFALSVSKIKYKDDYIYSGLLLDSTERRHLESRLIDNQHKLDSIINLAVDGIISIDERGVIEMVNPAAAKLFGYQQEELIGKHIRMLMPQPDKDNHDQYMENYHRTGIGKIIGIGREVTGLKKDGSVFPFKLSISEIFLRDRRIYTGIIHDLTAQKKAQEELRHLNQELETRVEQRTIELKKATEKIRKALEKEKELSELKSRFVSMASHEFRTPLSTILSSVALMSRYVHANEPSKLEKHLNRIHSSVNHLKNILDDFLSLSKLEEGKIGVNPEKFDMAALAKNVRDNMQLVTKTGQTIEYLDDGETILVTLDKMAVENIMINLLSNAIKYSPENKKIQLSTQWQNGPRAVPRRDGPHVYLTVTDEGIGIPAAEQNHLFERFFRAKNATNIQGTGLGLNIVKRYVELMEGEITFDSEENVGTTIYVKLPVSILQQPQA